MNRKSLERYAPQARRDFIQAVTDRAAFFGVRSLGEKKGEPRIVVEPVVVEGDVAIIGGRPFPRKIAEQRRRLEQRINRDGFAGAMEAMAYTWFNRLVAIRYMELHGYFDHGYRVLSHPQGNAVPELLEHATHVSLPGLDSKRVIELKLDATKESELYRMLLIAQCNALHRAMPFLFERIDDETELLLPDNLLHTDSLVRRLVEGIDEDDWKEVEIIGWLYQFYISEKKDEVIGKVVKSEDIPAATQLFTPNWIVKYLVQNSLGRQWMATYPNAALKAKMEYYIEPAEQTPEVEAQLKAITPESLNPEELTLLDPACGSGHILVEAYDTFKWIYQERGYRAKDIPKLILEKNLYGLEIDDRAAQLAAFALMMKARADDSRIFEFPVKMNVMAIQESTGLNAKEITEALNRPIVREEMLPVREFFEDLDETTPLFGKKNLEAAGDIDEADIAQLIALFEHGKTFGSLIRVPEELAVKLPGIERRVREVMEFGGMMEQGIADSLNGFIDQATCLALKYDAVVMNPPYMNSANFDVVLKTVAGSIFSFAKADLYSIFTARSSDLIHELGYIAMITPPNWLFLGVFEELRRFILRNFAIDSLVHIGRGVWGSDFGSCAFAIRKLSQPYYQSTFLRLFDTPGSVSSNEELRSRFFTKKRFYATSLDFESVAGLPLAYWASPGLRSCFVSSPSLANVANIVVGLQTGDDNRFLRFWHEVSFANIEFRAESGDIAAVAVARWFPIQKGGSFRKWFGNNEYVIDWEESGQRIKQCRPKSVVRNESVYFRPGISWSLISISAASFRQMPSGCLITNKGPGIYLDECSEVLGYLNSTMAKQFLAMVSPTIGFEVGHLRILPYRKPSPKVKKVVDELVMRHMADWDAHERSWAFLGSPLHSQGIENKLLDDSYRSWAKHCCLARKRCVELEHQNNAVFVDVFSMQDEVADVPDEKAITLTVPDKNEDIRKLISYAIGCMMGRYSLDEPGLIYAHSGNKGFDASKYQTYPADSDGIIPITEQAWFEDDVAYRFETFISTAWPKETLEENLVFVAESLGMNKDESSRETIRRYIATGFFKHHLQMYKRRPIYWLFSSGKLRAFQCLVYLHRYNEGTLARMRTEYVIPLQGRIAARIETLASDIASAASTSHKRKLEKERGALLKQQTELVAFDEQLRHYADQRIALDLDDGVKVNYGKFGNLLAEVKAVTGAD